MTIKHFPGEISQLSVAQTFIPFMLMKTNAPSTRICRNMHKMCNKRSSRQINHGSFPLCIYTDGVYLIPHAEPDWAFLTPLCISLSPPADGGELPPRVEQRNGQLHFTKVTRSDAGNYTCIASNSLQGEIRALVTLTVAGKPLTHHPRRGELWTKGSCSYISHQSHF